MIGDESGDPAGIDEPAAPGGPGSDGPEIEDPPDHDGDPTTPAPEAELVPTLPLLRRLTRDEYRFSVLDIMGVELSEGDLEAHPVDRPLEGFVNIASGQSVNPEHVRAYHGLATRIATDPVAASWMDAQHECREANAGCGAEVVESLGTPLFRRPLEARERALFEGLFAAVAAEAVPFARVRRAVLEAMLQSPPFLYLVQDELDGEGGVRTLGGYEVASRLSYMLWASAPDEALYQDAAAGELDDPVALVRQVRRMVDDPRANRTRARFLIDWAGLENLPDDDGLKAELIEGAVAFYEDHLAQGAPLMELFAAPKAFLTPALAEAYGLEGAGAGLREYDLSDVPDRMGLLAQPGVIAGMTNADGGEIVARGLFLQRQLFCGDTPDPPASLQDAIDAFVEELPETVSNRELAETRLMRPECGACHAAFDPLGYGFEHFDFRGGYREQDEHGNALASDGWIPGGFDAEGREVAFETFDVYMGLLEEHPRVRRCLVQRQLEYALATRLRGAQLPGVVDMSDALADGPVESMLEALVAHDLFRVQRVPEAE